MTGSWSLVVVVDDRRREVVVVVAWVAPASPAAGGMSE
jgi:hypothetical protein